MVHCRSKQLHLPTGKIVEITRLPAHPSPQIDGIPVAEDFNQSLISKSRLAV
jgi:hypothetical protein